MESATAGMRFTRLSEVTGALVPPMRPPLIDGVLRKGHKMLVAGPPKAGKTWLAIHLAYAVANGLEWMGHAVPEPGEVVLVDGEMDPNSFYHRCQSVARALWTGLGDAELGAMGERVSVMHLRGDQETDVGGLLRLMQARYDRPPELVIIDPIYKLLRGDENSNSEMREFVKGLDAIAAWGPSVCITHHHAKGRAGDRLVTDRAAGAGVFSRDPDAFVDLTPLDVRPGTDAWAALERRYARGEGEPEDEWRERLGSKVVLRANMVLREFPDRRGSEWVFDWPLMRPIDGMSEAPEEGSAQAARQRGGQAVADRASEGWALHDSLLTDAMGRLAAIGIAAPSRGTAYEAYARRCAEEGVEPRPEGSITNQTKPSGDRLSWVYDEGARGLVRRVGYMLPELGE